MEESLLVELGRITVYFELLSFNLMTVELFTFTRDIVKTCVWRIWSASSVGLISHADRVTNQVPGLSVRDMSVRDGHVS